MISGKPSVYLRATTLSLAAIYILSALLNMGLNIALGPANLAFSLPSTQIAGFEMVIATLLVAASVYPNEYVVGASYVLATVGIVEGLLSPEVQGSARNLHEIMIPVDLLGMSIYAVCAAKLLHRPKVSGSGSRRIAFMKVLQLFLGVLVAFGGFAFTVNGTFPVGTILGAAHLAIGLLDLLGAYFLLTSGLDKKNFLIFSDALTVIYSAISEWLAQAYGYLPGGITDAFVGTIMAIVAGCILLYLVVTLGDA